MTIHWIQTCVCAGIWGRKGWGNSSFFLKAHLQTGLALLTDCTASHSIVSCSQQTAASCLVVQSGRAHLWYLSSWSAHSQLATNNTMINLSRNNSPGNPSPLQEKNVAFPGVWNRRAVLVFDRQGAYPSVVDNPPKLPPRYLRLRIVKKRARWKEWGFVLRPLTCRLAEKNVCGHFILLHDFRFGCAGSLMDHFDLRSGKLRSVIHCSECDISTIVNVCISRHIDEKPTQLKKKKKDKHGHNLPPQSRNPQDPHLSPRTAPAITH